MNIDAIKRLTGRIPLDEDKTDTRTRACIEFSVRGTPKDRVAMQEGLMKLASELEMDFSFQQDNMYRRMRRLICFDMDSTLIETEVIDELAIRAGVGDQFHLTVACRCCYGRHCTFQSEILICQSFQCFINFHMILIKFLPQYLIRGLPLAQAVIFRIIACHRYSSL